MNEFFEVITLQQARAHAAGFSLVGTERVALAEAAGRVLADDVVSEIDLPGFRRSTMDGYAVRAASTFGASDSAPALLELVGSVEMGASAEGTVGSGQAVQILTGGMLPAGADAVVMVEHTEPMDDSAIEVTRAVAPQQNVIEADEDLAKGERLLVRGTRLRAQEIGLLAALGQTEVFAFATPVVSILSTGDEVVPVDAVPGPGQIRDVNSSTLSAMVRAAGGRPRSHGIVSDDFDALVDASRAALEGANMVILSGGSSVGTRDLTLEVLSALPDSEILAHGVAIKPGKPTILARVGECAFWGLPGHVVSAMVVFQVLVRHFLHHVSGVAGGATASGYPARARLSRNLASVHGRREFVRVRIEQREGELWAVPIVGKAGLVRTAVESDGLVEIGENSEGLSQGAEVLVHAW